jgi:murein L,D-transpeptidase YcbB/YkuD
MRTAMTLLLAALLWAAAALPGHAQTTPKVQDAEDVANVIAAILEDPERLPLPLERIRPALVQHYVQDKGAIYWVGTGRMTPFLQRLADAAEDGLNPADYPIDALTELRDSIDEYDPEIAATAELFFSAFFVSYAADLRIGRLTPQKVDKRLFRNRKTIDVLRVLTDLKKEKDPNAFLARFESQNPHYQALKKMLAVYRTATETMAWPRIEVGKNIEPGDSDPRIPGIRDILILTGDHPGDGDGGEVYDPETVLAVSSFQMRHGLEARGLVGKQTILALNVPPADRARQIMLNMERWRWMPEELGPHHFMVNLAGSN